MRQALTGCRAMAVWPYGASEHAFQTDRITGLHEADDPLSAIGQIAHQFHQSAADGVDGVVVAALLIDDSALFVAEFIDGFVDSLDDLVQLARSQVAEQDFVQDIAGAAHRPPDPGRMAHARTVNLLVHHKHLFYCTDLIRMAAPEPERLPSPGALSIGHACKAFYSQFNKSRFFRCRNCVMS